MRLVFNLFIIAVTIYSLLDCMRTPEEDLPTRMPRFMWILIILIVPVMGPIGWIITNWAKGLEGTGYMSPTVWSIWKTRGESQQHHPGWPGPVGPDDDPEFLRNLDRDVKRRKQEDED